MENDNHEIYGNPRNTGRRGLQVEAKTKSLLWPHSIGIRGPHSSNTKKGAKTSNSGVERNVIRYTVLGEAFACRALVRNASPVCASQTLPPF